MSHALFLDRMTGAMKSKIDDVRFSSDDYFISLLFAMPDKWLVAWQKRIDADASHDVLDDAHYIFKVLVTCFLRPIF